MFLTLKMHFFTIHGTYVFTLKILTKLFYYRHQNKLSSHRERHWEYFTFVLLLQETRDTP